jgi:exoribonuclease R
LSITNKLDASIIDSHDVISYWMVKMNIECGNYMERNNIGIFRLANYIHSIDPLFQKDISHLHENIQRVIKNWSNTTGQYVIYNNEHILEHELMKTKNYVHITSPIRRLVDLINQIWMTKHLNIIRNISNDADSFMQDWLYKLDYVNASMRSIRKIQTDCQTLYMCNNVKIMESIYDGIIFDKLKKNDGAIVYMVYLEELKLLNRMKTYVDFDNYTKHKFKIFVFEDEYKIKKKIRIQMV